MTHETVAWPWWANAFWLAAAGLHLTIHFAAPRLVRRALTHRSTR